jgi:hypothetical protein
MRLTKTNQLRDARPQRYFKCKQPPFFKIAATFATPGQPNNQNRISG